MGKNHGTSVDTLYGVWTEAGWLDIHHVKDHAKTNAKNKHRDYSAAFDLCGAVSNYLPKGDAWEVWEYKLLPGDQPSRLNEKGYEHVATLVPIDYDTIGVWSITKDWKMEAVFVPQALTRFVREFKRAHGTASGNERVMVMARKISEEKKRYIHRITIEFEMDGTDHPYSKTERALAFRNGGFIKAVKEKIRSQFSDEVANSVEMSDVCGINGLKPVKIELIGEAKRIKEQRG